jgi:hypothetical protein
MGFVDGHRPAVLGIAYGTGALIFFLLIGGFMGRASRSNAESSEAMIERRFEEARTRRARPEARPESARKQPRHRPAEPVQGGRQYEAEIRDGNASAAPAEHLPPIDAPPETRGEPLPDLAPAGAEDELIDPEG